MTANKLLKRFSSKAFSLFSVLILAFVLGACSNSGTNPNPDPNNPSIPNNPNLPSPSNPNAGLTYGNQAYPLKEGLAELEGETAYHYQIDFRLTDGRVQLVSIPIYGIDFIIIGYTNYWISVDNKVELFAELYSDGTSSFTTGTFSFAPSSEGGVGEPSRAGQNYFQNAYVAIDTSGNNETEEEEEIKATGGTITVSGTEPDYTLTFNLQLANGKSVTGTFSGEFTVSDL